MEIKFNDDFLKAFMENMWIASVSYETRKYYEYGGSPILKIYDKTEIVFASSEEEAKKKVEDFYDKLEDEMIKNHEIDSFWFLRVEVRNPII